MKQYQQLKSIVCIAVVGIGLISCSARPIYFFNTFLTCHYKKRYLHDASKYFIAINGDIVTACR